MRPAWQLDTLDVEGNLLEELSPTLQLRALLPATHRACPLIRTRPVGRLSSLTDLFLKGNPCAASTQCVPLLLGRRDPV